MKVNKLNGMKVISADAFALGEVDGAHVNLSSWEITDLDIKLTKESTKELGLKKPRLMSLTVCLPIIHVRHVGDVITLKESLAEFKDLEACKS